MWLALSAGGSLGVTEQNSGLIEKSLTDREARTFRFKEETTMNNSNEEVQPPDISPKSLDFGTLPQGASKILKELIKNAGKQPLLWRADTNGTSWLTLDKSTGTLQPGEQQVINVTVNAHSLVVGGYAATLTFTSEGDEQSVSVEVLVTLVVSPVFPPAVGLSFATLHPESSSTLPLLLSNTNSRPMDWTVDTNGTSWLTVNPSAGTLQPGEQLFIYVTANSNSLSAKRYLATLTFTTEMSGIKSAGVQVPILIFVGPKPNNDDGPHFPKISPKTLNFGKGKTKQRLTISNQDDGQVRWTLDTGGVNWLKVDPPSTNTLQSGVPQGVDVRVNNPPSAPGTYNTDLILTITYYPPRVRAHATTILVPVTLIVP
jgi:hypothetical protein